MSKIVDRKRDLYFKNKFNNLMKKGTFIVVDDDIPKKQEYIKDLYR